MGKLEVWESITMNAIFGGILRGEECEDATEKAAWLQEVATDQKLTFRRDEVIREVPETRAEVVLRALSDLVDSGLLLQPGRDTYRVSASGAEALAAEEGCAAEYMAALEFTRLPLAA
ncbi:hypothetical protein [Mesorhizobium sp. A623]